jgi:hypothetical protein
VHLLDLYLDWFQDMESVKGLPIRIKAGGYLLMKSPCMNLVLDYPVLMLTVLNGSIAFSILSSGRESQ